MSPAGLTMSTSEFERAALLRKVHEKRLTQAKAAEILGLSLCQMERLCRRYRKAGPAALALRRRGQPSNHRLARALKESVLELVRARYADFGPTLALEKLVECHGLVVSKETLRKWMTEDGLSVPHARRRDRVHQPRHRRSCTGELIQIDGCDHEWFEERSERCTLLVYIDDATSKRMELFFCDAESAFNYFDATPLSRTSFFRVSCSRSRTSRRRRTQRTSPRRRPSATNACYCSASRQPASLPTRHRYSALTSRSPRRQMTDPLAVGTAAHARHRRERATSRRARAAPRRPRVPRPSARERSCRISSSLTLTVRSAYNRAR